LPRDSWQSRKAVRFNSVPYRDFGHLKPAGAIDIGNQVGRRLRRDRADRKRGAEAKRCAPCKSAPAEWHYRDARNVPERVCF